MLETDPDVLASSLSVRAETLARARAYAAQAAEALAPFPDVALKRALIETTAFATARGS